MLWGLLHHDLVQIRQHGTAVCSSLFAYTEGGARTIDAKHAFLE